VPSPAAPSIVVRLDDGAARRLSGDGVHRSLAAADGDLNVNLAHLDPGSEIADHVNDDVDVLVVVLSGSGQLRVGETHHDLVPNTLAYLARGDRRSIAAGPQGLTYLSAHRARGPLQVAGAAAPGHDEGGDPPCWAHLV